VKTIVLDFDGTIMPHVWPKFAPPFSGVKDAIARMRQAGYKVMVHTCRTASYWEMMGNHQIPRMDEAIEQVRNYLKEYGIVVDGIWTADKPVATYYVDDRAIQFKGDWNDVCQQMGV
jgi:predicted HAD superfamily phosphohydrolase YqeG